MICVRPHWNWSAVVDGLERGRAAACFVALAVAAICSGIAPNIVRAEDGVDTALIVAVDVSQSVDEERYRLQMEGVAQALEDPSVIAAITGGARGGILLSMIAWSDQANYVVGWRRIASRQDAFDVAASLRELPLQSGEFTCMARMLRTIAVRIIPSIPIPATRIVVDISGDGIDNCSDYDELHLERDKVIFAGATINGLPIIVAGENDIVGGGAYRAPGYGLRELSAQPDHDTTTLDKWFQDHVIGGPGMFLLVANGYADFGRAMRQKFVTEISGFQPPEFAEQQAAGR